MTGEKFICYIVEAHVVISHFAKPIFVRVSSFRYLGKVPSTNGNIIYNILHILLKLVAIIHTLMGIYSWRYMRYSTIYRLFRGNIALVAAISVNYRFRCRLTQISLRTLVPSGRLFSFFRKSILFYIVPCVLYYCTDKDTRCFSSSLMCSEQYNNTSFTSEHNGLVILSDVESVLPT